ncbi:hypothetical protein [Phyllobacterium sp. YR531]|uniref:hypothetical protein n=1 Tax=Phyllobacterium sp. YR531 TaxID=1144343 RepID=UPI00026F8768|nr:hypothetical protein [Phyllobacterium sp. YR531]EJN01362.1 hypothetical protein PMI41_03444 [Phyllobacterium sp. YR531]
MLAVRAAYVVHWRYSITTQVSAAAMVSAKLQIFCTIFLSLSGLKYPALAQGNALSDRPGLAGPEEMPKQNVSCEGLAATIAGLEVPSGDRIDLWATGPLTYIHSDEALWYLAICSEPGVQVMCITYSGNGMKIGERILIRGGMRMLDKTHIVLDPCLASRAE